MGFVIRCAERIPIHVHLIVEWDVFAEMLFVNHNVVKPKEIAIRIVLFPVHVAMACATHFAMRMAKTVP